MAAVDNFAPGGDFISLQAEGAWEARPGPSGLGVGLVWAWCGPGGLCTGCLAPSWRLGPSSLLSWKSLNSRCDFPRGDASWAAGPRGLTSWYGGCPSSEATPSL